MVVRLPAACRPRPLHLVILALLASPVAASEQELALGVLHISDEYQVLAERQNAKAAASFTAASSWLKAATALSVITCANCRALPSAAHPVPPRMFACVAWTRATPRS